MRKSIAGKYFKGKADFSVAGAIKGAEEGGPKVQSQVVEEPKKHIEDPLKPVEAQSISTGKIGGSNESAAGNVNKAAVVIATAKQDSFGSDLPAEITDLVSPTPAADVLEAADNKQVKMEKKQQQPPEEKKGPSQQKPIGLDEVKMEFAGTLEEKKSEQSSSKDEGTADVLEPNTRRRKKKRPAKKPYEVKESVEAPANEPRKSGTVRSFAEVPLIAPESRNETSKFQSITH